MGLKACVCDLADLNEGVLSTTMAVGSVHFSHCLPPCPQEDGRRWEGFSSVLAQQFLTRAGFRA